MKSLIIERQWVRRKIGNKEIKKQRKERKKTLNYAKIIEVKRLKNKSKEKNFVKNEWKTDMCKNPNNCNYVSALSSWNTFTFPSYISFTFEIA